jgi:hypothetical protein
MREHAFLPADKATDAFGEPPRPRRGIPLATLLAAIVVCGVFAMLALFSVRGWLHVGTLMHSCVGSGIGTREGREGQCERVNGLFSQPTVYNVVDRHHALRMPEYEARLLVSTISSTRITGASINKRYYPNGHGWLVSFQLQITNTGDTPLLYGQTPGATTRHLYPRHPQVELLIPPSLGSSDSGSDDDIALDELINGNGAPGPSIGLRRLIEPHASITGWATFVAPEWSRSLLSARPADLDLLRVDDDSHYVGQIRLWK